MNEKNNVQLNKTNYFVKLCSLFALFILLGSYFFTGVFSNNYIKVKQDIYYRVGDFKSNLKNKKSDWQSHYSGYLYKIDNNTLFVSGFNSSSYFVWSLFDLEDLNVLDSQYIGITYNTNQKANPNYGQYYIATDLEVRSKDNSIEYLEMTPNDTIYLDITNINSIYLYFPIRTGINYEFTYNYYSVALNEYISYDWTYKLDQLADLRNIFDTHFDYVSNIELYSYDTINSFKHLYDLGIVDYELRYPSSTYRWYVVDEKMHHYLEGYDLALYDSLINDNDILNEVRWMFYIQDDAFVVNDELYRYINEGIVYKGNDSFLDILTMPFYWVGNLIYDIGVFVRFIIFW